MRANTIKTMGGRRLIYNPTMKNKEVRQHYTEQAAEIDAKVKADTDKVLGRPRPDRQTILKLLQQLAESYKKQAGDHFNKWKESKQESDVKQNRFYIGCYLLLTDTINYIKKIS